MTTEALAAIEPDVTTVTQEETSAPSVEEKENDAPADAQEEPAKEEKPEPTEAEKIRHAMQKRIDNLTKKSSNTERELIELRQLVQAKQQQEQADARPKEDDFETTEDFLKAEGAWEERQKIKADADAKKQQEQAKTYQERIQKRSEEVAAQEAEFRKTTPDYDEASQVLNEYVATANVNSVEFGVFRDILMEAKNLPAMTYELGKNPDVIEKLMTSSPAEIARTLFRMEYDLERAPKTQTQPNPKPLSPTTGGSKTTKGLEEMDYKELKKRFKL